MFLTVLISLLIGTNGYDSVEIGLYQQALDQIILTKEFQSLSKAKNKYYVSNELPSFYSMGWFYKKEISSYIEVNEEDFISESNKSVDINDDLLKFRTKKCAKLKIYFSQIKEGVFFAEVLKSPKKNVKYKDRPHFGTSFAYMFEAKENKVRLVGVKEIAYN